MAPNFWACARAVLEDGGVAAWWNGRHSRLKICFWETGVPVRVRPRPPKQQRCAARANQGSLESGAYASYAKGNWTLRLIRNGGDNMANKLEELVIRTRKIRMTPDQLREQRQSFAYGNTNIENERITREMVAEADRKIEAESK
jgi:hypothetical protein